MKTLNTIIIVLLLSPILTYSKIDVEKVKSDFEVMQNAGNAGREFWLTVTPQSKSNFDIPDRNIYLFSSIKTKVDFTIKGNSYKYSIEVMPNVVTLLEIDNLSIEPTEDDFENPKPSDIYEDMALHIESEYPVVIYVFLKHFQSSDGYFAIPSFGASEKYINMTYFSSNYSNGLIPSYTAIVSHHDSTSINLVLGGGRLAEEVLEMKGTKSIKTGESMTQQMNSGDVFLLGTSGNLQDFSGSLFESDKPISIVSGVDDTYIPLDTGDFDYITNMEFSTNVWGSQYYFTPLQKRDGVSFFRVFASEDNTNVYRDGELMGNIKKGGGADYGESFIEFDTGKKSSDMEPTTINSDKPIGLMYYNKFEKRANVINIYDRDPHMFQVPSIEQGVKSAIFASPYKYTEGEVILRSNNVVVTFPLENGFIPNDIELLTFDSLGILSEKIKLNEIQEIELNEFNGDFKGKEYGSVTLEIENNKVYHLISVNSKFVAYSYGADLILGYGLPSAFSVYNRTLGDSLPPVVYYEQDCDGNINLNTATVTDMPMNEENRSNIADAYMMVGENYEFKWETESGEFIPGRNQTIRWSLEKINKNQPASALLYFVDKAGNDTTIFIESDPKAELEMLTTLNEIRNPNFSSLSFQDTIRNMSTFQSLYITRVEVANTDSKFKIDSNEPSGWNPGTPIPPNQERYINYTFTNNNIEDNMTYSDSIYIGFGVNNGDQITECEFKPFSEVSVSTVFPQLFATQKHNFGTFDDDSKSIKLQDTIRNLSSKTDLYLSRIELKEKDKGFSIGSISPFDWNIDKPIKPESEVIVDIIFNPKAYPQTEDEQILVDSLGIGIQEYDKNNELEEVSFSFRTEHQATIEAKDPESSVTPDKVLEQYLNVTESSIELLPKVLQDGFYDISIYTLEGAKLISIATDKQNTISLSKLTSGTYLVTLKSTTQLLSKKISVVR